ncbi:MAG: hemerythrin domain-containing protein [Sphingomonadaceae bacterium]|nr:hemerythrin domain-containing protein [Sphingomonadaceae bacterium]
MSDYAKRNGEGDHRIKDDDPKAIALLKEEHHKFRELFDQANDAEGDELVEVARELSLRLTVHMTIEEEILYPVGKQVGDADEVDEGIVEHEAGKQLMAEIDAMDGSEELFKSKVHVLGEQTIHHIDEEDEELFAEMIEAHEKGKIDLDAIGEELRARQADLYDQIASGHDVEPLSEDEALAETK